MRKAIVALFLITAILLLSIRQERETIIIYSSMEQFRGEELQKQLNEQFPDLHAMVVCANRQSRSKNLCGKGSK